MTPHSDQTTPSRHSNAPRPGGAKRPLADETGATALEWTLLLAAIALPSYAIILLALQALGGYYHMVTTLNGLPLP